MKVTVEALDSEFKPNYTFIILIKLISHSFI
jgi:hypothetical protein